jgi:hypothetical protein
MVQHCDPAPLVTGMYCWQNILSVSKACLSLRPGFQNSTETTDPAVSGPLLNFVKLLVNLTETGLNLQFRPGQICWISVSLQSSSCTVIVTCKDIFWNSGISNIHALSLPLLTRFKIKLSWGRLGNRSMGYGSRPATVAPHLLTPSGKEI